MATYRADLTGDHHSLIAHLKPGDTVYVTTSLGDRQHTCDGDGPAWLALYDDEPCYRSALFGTGARLAQNTRVRQRAPISAAVKALRPGGVAYIVHELRQETDKFGVPYGPKVPLAAGHVLVEPECSGGGI